MGARYEGLEASAIAARLGLPAVHVFDEVSSTLDVAHVLAGDGAPAGTLILADAQTAGRGRLGRSWRSERGAGIWLTLIERPVDAAVLDVLSLRIGLWLAPALDRFVGAGKGSGDRVRLKWPNDLYVERGKLAGILIEARWRDGAPEWVAIGVGINVAPPPSEPGAAGLQPDASRLEVLTSVIPAMRGAAARTGRLTTDELRSFAERDLAAGRSCVEPVRGRVAGIDASGALLVDVASTRTAVRAGSLIFEGGQSGASGL